MSRLRSDHVSSAVEQLVLIIRQVSGTSVIVQLGQLSNGVRERKRVVFSSARHCITPLVATKPLSVQPKLTDTQLRSRRGYDLKGERAAHTAWTISVRPRSRSSPALHLVRESGLLPLMRTRRLSHRARTLYRNGRRHRDSSHRRGSVRHCHQCRSNEIRTRNTCNRVPTSPRSRAGAPPEPGHPPGDRYI